LRRRPAKRRNLRLVRGVIVFVLSAPFVNARGETPRLLHIKIGSRIPIRSGWHQRIGLVVDRQPIENLRIQLEPKPALANRPRRIRRLMRVNGVRIQAMISATERVTNLKISDKSTLLP